MYSAMTMPNLNQITVIIPVAPGERCHQNLLDDLVLCAPELAVVLVYADVDQCTVDAKTFSVLAFSSLNCIVAERGRASQLNAGAKLANSIWLWFLHADSKLNTKLIASIRRYNNPTAMAYADLYFYDGPKQMLINSFGVWWRSRLFALPFGDQSFLVTRSLFNSISGFRINSNMGEDHAFVFDLTQRGVKILALGAWIGTSARKYRTLGWWKTTKMHLRQTLSQSRDLKSTSKI